MKSFILFLLLVTTSFAQASLYKAQERIHIYLKAPVKIGDVQDEELAELGDLYEILGKLNKEDYERAIEFLRDNWNINKSNAQRLFIFLQKDWIFRIGSKIKLAEISTKYLDAEMGFAAGTAVFAANTAFTTLNYLTLLKPIIAIRRNPFSVFNFNWLSGVPIATTYAASTVLQDTFKTDAAKDLMKIKPASPAEIVGIPMVMPDAEGKNTLDQYELDQLYSLAISLGISGVANDLAKLRSVATGVKTVGTTGGRVMLALTLAAAVGYVAETGLDVYMQNDQFEHLAKDLRKNIKILNSMKLLTDKQKISARTILRAQNLYAQTINLMQFELVGYLKAAKENAGQVNELQSRVAKNLTADPTDTMWHSSWRKDADEASLYLALTDMRNGLLNSMRNKECQSDVDQYLKLNQRVEDNPADEYLKKTLNHLTNYLVKQFSEGKFCGGDSALLSGHPLHLLLSAKLYLQDFSHELTWLQTQSLNDRFLELLDSYTYAKNKVLLSPNERKIRDGELPDPTRKGNRWIRNRLKQQPQ